MGRITFYAISLTGMFLLVTRNPDEFDPVRHYGGYTMVILGFLGLIWINIFRRRRAASEESEAEPQVNADERRT
jgi:hypothetical protein